MHTLRLYHRTSAANAARIMSELRMISMENTQEVYFSTELAGEAAGYGDAVVCIVIPVELAELDDEFPSGEQHYRVRVADILPEHFRI